MVFWSCYFFDWKKRKEGCGFKALSMKLLLLLTCVCVRVVGGMLLNTISLSFAAVTSCNLCRQGIHLSCKEVFLASATSVLFNIRYIRISICMYREISNLFYRERSPFPVCQLSFSVTNSLFCWRTSSAKAIIVRHDKAYINTSYNIFTLLGVSLP